MKRILSICLLMSSIIACAVVAQATEPEVEIELIVEEESQEEVKEELEKQETIEPLESIEAIESLEILDEVEVVEPVAEPAPAPQPEAIAHAEGKQYVGVQLGFTQPITRLNLPVPDQEKNLTPTVLNGFKVGVVYDATIVKGFGYTLGLNYTFGANTSEWKKVGILDYPRTQKQELYHQLEIPVDWQYKFEIANKTYLMLYTGPTLQVGLSYKQNTRTQMTSSGETASVDKDVYTMDGVFALKRLNVTWGVGAGLQYERYFLRGGYDFGLINPYKEATFHVSDDYNPYTRGRFDQWQIKIGMYLWEF